MIVRRDSMRSGHDGGRAWLHCSDMAGLTQFGAYVDTLPPGTEAAEGHWHESEDELVFVLTGELTVVEDGVAATLGPGDAACWRAGSPVAHAVANRSTQPCTFLTVGTRVTHDVCHYPASGRTLHTEGETWRIEAADGAILKTGRCKSPPGRD